MPVSMAVVNTPHFVFHGLGNTSQEAVEAALRAWAYHAEQTGADLDYVRVDDVNVITGEPGQGFRDYSPVPTIPATPTPGRGCQRRPSSS
jgi:hypothetical protein